MADYPSTAKARTEVFVNDYVRSVYNWMCIGLALTGFVSYYVSNSPAIQNLVFGNRIIFFGLIIVFFIFRFFMFYLNMITDPFGSI